MTGRPFGVNQFQDAQPVQAPVLRRLRAGRSAVGELALDLRVFYVCDTCGEAEGMPERHVLFGPQNRVVGVIYRSGHFSMDPSS